MHKRTFFLTQRKLNSTQNPLELVIFLRDTPMTFRFFLNFQLFILTKYLLAVPYILIIFQGYILIEDFFDVKKELDPVREAINTLVDDLAKKLYDAGKIKSKQILYDNFLSLKNYATITCKYTFMVNVIFFNLVLFFFRHST